MCVQKISFFLNKQKHADYKRIRKKEQTIFKQKVNVFPFFMQGSGVKNN